MNTLSPAFFFSKAPFYSGIRCKVAVYSCFNLSCRVSIGRLLGVFATAALERFQSSELV
jgi:hypothetical protein